MPKTTGSSDTRNKGAVTDVDYRSLARFRRALRAFLYFSEQAAKAAGVTPSQHQLMLAIRGTETEQPPTIGEVAGWMKLRHHSMVELVDRAEAAGLVRRVQDSEDLRRQRLVLTKLGEGKLAQLSSIHREELRRFREEGLGQLDSLL